MTNPHDDKARIEHDKGPHNQASCKWIFHHADFQKWRNSPNSQLLWIKGDVGKGKTMLLAGIINEMLPQKKQPDESDCQAVVVTYFFCQRHDQRINNATAVLRGLIYLLAVQQEVLTKHLIASYNIGISDPFEDVNAVFNLTSKLVDMLCDIKATVYLIVDALDECGTGLEQLLSQILIIACKCNNVRWLVSSRDNSLIKRRLGLGDGTGRFQLELNAENISPAVDIYIDTKLSDLEWLKHDTALQDQVRAKIHEKAGATFLWVSLVCDELEAEDGSSVLRVLEDAPTQLDLMQSRSRACALLKLGYEKFEDFKKNSERKDYQLLRNAIVQYREAIVESRKPMPRYQTGILRAYISLAECHRELSHSYKLSPSAKMGEVEEAEKHSEDALRLAEETGDERRTQRAQFEMAVLRARKVLVEMKQRNLNPAAYADLRAKLCAAQNGMMNLREQYERVENQRFVTWANRWLKLLDEAIRKLKEK